MTQHADWDIGTDVGVSALAAATRPEPASAASLRHTVLVTVTKG